MALTFISIVAPTGVALRFRYLLCAPNGEVEWLVDLYLLCAPNGEDEWLLDLYLFCGPNGKEEWLVDLYICVPLMEKWSGS